MDLKEEIAQIHSKYGTTYLANHKIQRLIEKLFEESNERWVESREQTARARERSAIWFMLNYYVDDPRQPDEMEDEVLQDYYTRGRKL